MIIRIFQASIFENKVDTFREFFTETAIPLVKSQPGLVSLSAGLPRPETPTEFAMIMGWKNEDAIRAFAGEDWQKPHIDPAEADLVHHRRLSHYKLCPAAGARPGRYRLIRP